MEEPRQQPTTNIGDGLDEQAMADASYDKIRRRAYDIWVDEGRPEGRQHEHWMQAEREVLQEAGIEARPSEAERGRH